MSDEIKQDVIIESYESYDVQSVFNEELLCDQSFIESTINCDRLKVSFQVYKIDNSKIIGRCILYLYNVF